MTVTCPSCGSDNVSAGRDIIDLYTCRNCLLWFNEDQLSSDSIEQPTQEVDTAPMTVCDHEKIRSVKDIRAKIGQLEEHADAAYNNLDEYITLSRIEALYWVIGERESL